MKAGKVVKGRILDEVVSVTGWSRDNARRRLGAAAGQAPGSGRQVVNRVRKPRSLKYSYDALRVLQRVWAASGGQCGMYLAASMRIQLDGLERHGELAFGQGRYGPAVRGELLAMSAASIDRYLKGVKATDQLRGKSTTKPSPLLRSSVQVRRAGDEVEAEPGFFEGDTVAHCGPTLKGELARALNLTDVHTGWVFTRTVRNNAHVRILGALNAGVQDPVRGDRCWPPGWVRMSASWWARMELIRFAGANRLKVEIDHRPDEGRHGVRLAEPYSIRRTREGHLVLFVVNDLGALRSYRVDRIAGVAVTRTPFRPRYLVEF